MMLICTCNTRIHKNKKQTILIMLLVQMYLKYITSIHQLVKLYDIEFFVSLKNPTNFLFFVKCVLYKRFTKCNSSPIILQSYVVHCLRRWSILIHLHVPILVGNRYLQVFNFVYAGIFNCVLKFVFENNSCLLLTVQKRSCLY